MNQTYIDPSIGRLLRKKEVAAVFNVTERTIDRWVEKKLINCIRIGHTVRFHPDVIISINTKAKETCAA